jgi:hypothetical protein
VDLASTCIYRQSVGVFSGSNLTVGEIVDLGNGNTNCQIYVNGLLGSGAIQVQVQTSDSTTSGSFTDPTSGLPQMPSAFTSGGQFFANSGIAWGSGNTPLTAPVVSGAPLFCSGGIQFASFQQPHRYARLIYVSGPFLNPIQAGFITNLRTTGSGGGQTQAPSSGGVSV